MVAVVAQWIRQCLPSYGPGSDLKHAILTLILKYCNLFVIALRKGEDKPKEALAHILKHSFFGQQIQIQMRSSAIFRSSFITAVLY